MRLPSLSESILDNRRPAPVWNEPAHDYAYRTLRLDSAIGAESLTHAQTPSMSQAEFDAAAAKVKTFSRTPTSDEMLRLYGLFKQARATRRLCVLARRAGGGGFALDVPSALARTALRPMRTACQHEHFCALA